MTHIVVRKFALALASFSFFMAASVLMLCTTVYGETPELPRKRNAPMTAQPSEYPISCTNLVIEHLAAYDGVFWEDGSGRQVEGVAALMVRNQGKRTVPYAHITVTTRDADFIFDATMLPPGGRVLIPEREGKLLGDSKIVEYFGWNTVKPTGQELSLEIWESKEPGIRLQNISNEKTPQFTVFYRTYMEEENFYMGGKAFETTLPEIDAGAWVDILPKNYAPGYSKVVYMEETPKPFG